MSVFLIRINENQEICSIKKTNGLIDGHIELTEKQYADFISADTEMRRSSRGDKLKWVDGKMVVPEDPRRSITVTLNGGTRDITCMLGDAISIKLTLDNDANFNGEDVFDFGGRKFLFNFVDGVCTRDVSAIASGYFAFYTDKNYILSSEIKCKVIE